MTVFGRKGFCLRNRFPRGGRQCVEPQVHHFPNTSAPQKFKRVETAAPQNFETCYAPQNTEPSTFRKTPACQAIRCFSNSVSSSTRAKTTCGLKSMWETLCYTLYNFKIGEKVFKKTEFHGKKNGMRKK